jgi:16S rRNA (cytidine1402-2'-O)-methyltransferase
MSGILYLIPSPIGNIRDVDYITKADLEILLQLKYFLVEEEKTARAFLHYCGHSLDSKIVFIEYNEHNYKNYFNNEWLKYLKAGNNIGLISEAGTPCIADPGSEIVLTAHLNNIEVKPFVIPSSILLALMSSGLNGQRFTFHGYLNKNIDKLKGQIKYFEKESKKNFSTQIFMDTPYRSQKTFETLINTLYDNTLLCVAAELSTANQFIKTKQVKAWKKTKINLDKKRCIFLFISSNH